MKVNDRELVVEVAGRGPAVLFVHGLGSTSNFYQIQADALADRFQVIRVDSAGAGRSPVAGVPFHIWDRAGDGISGGALRCQSQFPGATVQQAARADPYEDVRSHA
jgi:pimeloyl-ACP methyl ester carboxylesterase